MAAIPVGFGVKYSAVHDELEAVVEVSVQLCPFTLPFPIGKRNEFPFRNCFFSGPLTNDVEEPPVGTTAAVDVLRIFNEPVELVVIIPFVSNKFPVTSIAPPVLTVNPALFDISR